MRLMLNDGESVTIQCNHVLSGDQVMAHSFTFSNHGGELCGREFNAAQKNGEAPETIDNTARDAISLLAEFYEYWEDNYAASPDFYEKVRKMCGIAKRHP